MNNLLRRTILIASITGMFCWMACATLEVIHSDPRAEVVAAYDAYEAVLGSLVEAREAGIFTAKQAAQITMGLNEVDSFLLNWQNQVLRGERPDAWGHFQELLKGLQSYLTKSEEI